MNHKTFALKGTVCYSKNLNEISIMENGYVICEDHVSAGVYPVLPIKYEGIPVKDFGDDLILPGFTDLHLHAPQYSYRGLGMDMELLDWLNTYAFPEEARYACLEYADKAYNIFARDLVRSLTTRACIFATLHVPATMLLMDILEKTGIKAYVGKVNMDRNGAPGLQEKSAEASAQDTLRWIRKSSGRYENIKPILTPRFTPSCSAPLMKRLGEISREYKLPVQSHLSENLGEIAWVKELCPDTEFYGEAYDKFGLFGGGEQPVIMAHCVHCPDEEIALMKKRGVYIAHCAQSNTNLASGIAPVRRYLQEEIPMGLGSDIAGGAHLSMFRVMCDSIQASKLRWRLVDDTLAPLTVEEAFYLATMGGGSFFGKVGSFEEGFEFDAVIMDDKNLPYPEKMSPAQRLERLIYLGDDRNVVGKYVAGRKITGIV